jgi:hypothetical protein
MSSLILFLELILARKSHKSSLKIKWGLFIQMKLSAQNLAGSNLLVNICGQIASCKEFAGAVQGAYGTKNSW